MIRTAFNIPLKAFPNSSCWGSGSGGYCIGLVDQVMVLVRVMVAAI